MPRRPSFRRDDDLKEQIRKLNRNVQNKQSRIRMNTGLETEGYDTVKFKDFSSRKEVERYIKKQKQFLDRKANFGVMNEKGVMLEYDLVKQLDKKIKKVNKVKEQQFDKIKDLPFTHKGKNLGLTVGQMANPLVGMGDSRYSDFRGLKFNPHVFESNSQLKKRVDKMEDLYEKRDFMKEKNELLKNNYLKGMSEAGLLELKKGREIADRIKAMDMEDFIRNFYTENNASISFLYDKTAKNARVTELGKVWSKKKGA